MAGGHHISDDELSDVRKFVAQGRAIPAVIVAAILSRMDRAEAALAVIEDRC